LTTKPIFKHLKFLTLIFSLIFSFGIYCNTDNFKSQYYQAKSKVKKNDVVLEWIEYSIQNDHSLVDSLFKNQNLAQFTDNQKFELCFYALLYANSTNKPSLIPVSKSKFKPYSLEYNLLRGFKNCLDDEPIESLVYQKLQENSADLKTADQKALYTLISAHNTSFNKYNRDTEKLLIEALKHAKRAKIKLITSAVFEYISNYYIKQEAYEKAVLYNQKGLDLASKENHKFSEVYHLFKLGYLQLNTNNFLKARSYLKDALEKVKNLNALYLKGRILGAIGNSYEKTLHANKAINYYQKALICFYNIDDNKGIASIHKDLGNSYFINKNLNLAEKNYTLSQNYLEELDEEEELAELYHYQAELALEKGSYHKSQKLINKAITLWSKNGNTIELYNSYLLLSKISKALNKYKEAYFYLEKYTEYQDSLNDKRTKERLAELSELYQAEQKEKRILEQQKEIEEQASEQLIREQQLENTQLRNRQIATILVFSIILFISILLIVYFKTKQDKLKKQQREIELKQALLRSQMDPHFIFNSMSIIQSYIYDNDLTNSSKFLVNFSRLIRLILENSAKEFITLNIEIEILERYLEIQKKRFEERFNYEIVNYSNLDTSSILIPPMLLQPFIENALEHGELNKVKDGKIRITFKIENDLLIFVIEDNGIGRQASKEKRKSDSLSQHTSMAIDITNSRIELLNDKYKNTGFLSIQDLTEDGEYGTRVTIATLFQINE
jgi:tetratricopeptide (TPR) repeat protein